MSEKIWSDDAWEDYLYWQTQDKKTIKRINQLIKDIERNGCMEGIGKPEPLTGDLQNTIFRHSLIYCHVLCQQIQGVLEYLPFRAIRLHNSAGIFLPIFTVVSGFRLPKRHTVSTWLERTGSTSFTLLLRPT